VARTRALRPGFFTNDTLGAMRPVVRLLFAGLWTIADRAGRLEDRPLKIQAAVLPYDHLNIDKALAELASVGFINRYSVGDGQYIQICTWTKHQHPHPREDASTLPPPPGYEAGPRYDPEPDLDTPSGHAQAGPEAGPRYDPGPSRTSSSRSFNSLREDPPTPQGGRHGRRRRNGVAFDDDGPRYEQRVGADGKREWVEVSA